MPHDDSTSGIYVHLPFCRRKCDYCGFFSLPVDTADAGLRNSLFDRYLESLRCELDSRLEHAGVLKPDTIYFGGGTPSLFGPGRISALIDMFRTTLSVSADPEISMEMNPSDCGSVPLMEYRSAGINRIVLGVQTMDADMHRFIGRSAEICTEGTLRVFFEAEGFDHCIDVITGIPGGEDRTLEIVCGYRPDHISAYLLSIERGTPLAKRFREDDDFHSLQRKEFYRTGDLLLENGYEQYEISNYSLPGRLSRHNMKYWKFMPYLGLGCAAHSFVGGSRWSNPASLEGYLADPLVRISDRRNRGQEMAEYIMTGLRLACGIGERDFRRTFGVPFPDSIVAGAVAWSEKGDLSLDGPYGERVLRAEPDGYFFLDGIVFDLVRDLLQE